MRRIGLVLLAIGLGATPAAAQKGGGDPDDEGSLDIGMPVDDQPSDPDNADATDTTDDTAPPTDDTSAEPPSDGDEAARIDHVAARDAMLSMITHLVGRPLRAVEFIGKLQSAARSKLEP